MIIRFHFFYKFSKSNVFGINLKVWDICDKICGDFSDSIVRQVKDFEALKIGKIFDLLQIVIIHIDSIVLIKRCS